MCAVQIIERGDGDMPLAYRLTLSPAAEPRRALKYHFLVPPVDRVKGNAATFYYKAMVFEGPDWISAIGRNEEIGEWLEASLGEPLGSEIDQALASFQRKPLKDLRRAATCDRCDWADNYREEGMETLLEQSQRLRPVAWALALLARRQIAENKFDDAVGTLAVGYGLSRSFAHGCCLVQCMIGLAIQNAFDDQTLTLMAAKDSPDLYWALTELAAEPIDLRRAISIETKIREFTFHELEDLDSLALTTAQAETLAHRIWKSVDRVAWKHIPTAPQSLSSDAILGWAMQLADEAREYLAVNGFSVEQLHGMPILQMALLYRWKQFQVLRDEYTKWALLPDSELLGVLGATYSKVEETMRTGAGYPFTTSFPAPRATHLRRLGLRRQTDILRTIEAIRMHAATSGALPASLEEVDVVPVPRDPFTDLPFDYSFSDGVATLRAPADPRNLAVGILESPRYELVLV